MPATLDNFPARRSPSGPKPRPAQTTTGVRLDPTEEAARRFGYRTPAEIDADWAAYDAWQAAVSLWLAGRGPRPE
jgi:hypothetical protein